MSVIGMFSMTSVAGAKCEGGGPGTSEYNKRHHINETAPAMPNPDPKPERRGPGRPPTGKSVTFSVTAARSMGTIIVTYRVGDADETFHMSGTKHWGTFTNVGTPVGILAAPDKAANDDGTFKHGEITVRIKREPANAAEGGPIICQDTNGPGLTGGAQCAGVV